MDILFEEGNATARQVMEKMADPPSYATVRTILRVLLRKNQVKHRKEGKAYIYSPVAKRDAAATSALQRILKTYFNGSVEKLISGLMGLNEEISPEELARIEKLIQESNPTKPTNDESSSL